jgi:hypothetical protein
MSERLSACAGVAVADVSCFFDVSSSLNSMHDAAKTRAAQTAAD